MPTTQAQLSNSLAIDPSASYLAFYAPMELKNAMAFQTTDFHNELNFALSDV